MVDAILNELTLWLAEHYQPAADFQEADKLMSTLEIKEMFELFSGLELDPAMVHQRLHAVGYRYDLVPGEDEIKWMMKTTNDG